MNDIRIDINLTNGNTLNVEPISYFEVVNTGEKYLFYTLNETVENGLIKMYAVKEAENNNNNFNINQEITDEEWSSLKEIMKSLITGAVNSNIKILEIEV